MNQFDSDKIRKLCAAHEEFRHHQGEFEIYREELTAAFDPRSPSTGLNSHRLRDSLMSTPMETNTQNKRART